MTRKEIISLYLQIALVILGVIYLIAFFNKGTMPPNNSGEIKAKDETIQAVIRERETYRAWKDEAIAQRNAADSLLRIKYKSNTVIYEKVIPATVAAYDNSELTSAVETYR